MTQDELTKIIDQLHDTMMNENADDTIRHMARMLRDMLPAWVALGKHMSVHIDSRATDIDKSEAAADVMSAMNHTIAKLMLMMIVQTGPGGPPPQSIVDWMIHSIGPTIEHEYAIMKSAWEDRGVTH